MIRLYRAPWSTNVERVALALAYKCLEVESVVVDYSDRSLVERVSGQPLVPVIEEDGTVVADSSRILEYLEERHPEPALFPAEPARRAEVDVFIDWFDKVWKRPVNEIEAELRQPEPDRELVERLGARMGSWLDLFEQLLDSRDYIMGDEFSAADCAAFPFLNYARGRDPEDDHLFHSILVDYQPLGPRHRRLAAWMERVDARPRAY